MERQKLPPNIQGDIFVNAKMADYDSDSSANEETDIQTNVLLGYASREPTGDDFSQLGGRPVDHPSSSSFSMNYETRMNLLRVGYLDLVQQ